MGRATGDRRGMRLSYAARLAALVSHPMTRSSLAECGDLGQVCRLLRRRFKRLAPADNSLRQTGKASMTSKTQPTVALNDGATMPQFGLGVFQTPPDETERVVKMAVDEGYRLVDTASMYRNEEGVGKALLGRTDVFVTTKLGNSDHGFDEALRAFDASIKKLRRETLDLVFDPLAAPARQPLCRKLEGARSSAEGREDSLDRRLEFQSRSPRADHRRNGRHACGESDRASPAFSAKDAPRIS